MIALHRFGGLRLPRFDERLEVEDDGRFRLWRSVAMAVELPSPVGRFGGTVAAARLARLRAAAADSANEGMRTWLVTPDSPVDRLGVDGVTATLGMRDGGEGPWAELAALLRPLLKELTSSPLAAIALDAGSDGAALVHAGDETIGLDLRALNLEATLWRDGDSAAHWSAPDHDLGEQEAGPGWRFQLPFDHGFEVTTGDRIAVSVSFELRDGERVVGAKLQTP